MPVEWVAFGWAPLALAAGVCLLSAAIAILLRLAILYPLVTAVRNRLNTADEARKRYESRAARATRIGFVVFTALLSVLLVARPLLVGAGVTWPLPTFSAALSIGVVALCATTWYLMQRLTSIFLGLTKAYASVSGRTISFAAAIKYGIVLVIRCLAALALVEAVDLLVVFGRLALLWLIPLAAGVGFLVYRFLAPYEQQWLFRSAPIKQTQWASLAPRCEAWARRAGVRIGSIQVLASRDTGGVGASFLGMGRPTLFLSDTLLERLDWRQQDALVAMLVGTPRVRSDVTVTKLMWVVGEASLLAGFCLALTYLDVVGSEALRAFGPLVVAPLVSLAMTTVLRRVTSGYGFERYARLADQHGAELCGDPVALMVALHTASALRGDPTAVATRISALDRLRQRPGPWAPWADAPVPAAVPFAPAGLTLTAPLDSAPAPAPSPATPYAIRGPIEAPALASSMVE